MTHRRK
jgi:hypothetical protein